MTDHNLCERKWQLLQCHCNYTACIAKNDRWISDSISDADKKRVLHFCIQNQPESFIPVTILLSYEQCYVQHLLSTIHSNKLSVESKTGERRMDKCWNSIGMGFKCWRQREWRMKFYHLHLCVQCFWLFVLFDWHIPNYDDSDNNSSICANAVLPTTKCTWMWVIAIEHFLGIFLSISSTFFLVVEMYVMSWINKTYRTISNIAHIASTSQKLTKWRFLTALRWSKILWCECRRRYIMDHLKNECKEIS